MKQIKNILIAMILLLSVSAISQPQLTWRFANPQLITGDTQLQFDVEVMGDAPGWYIYIAQLGITYNEAAFGSNIYSSGNVLVETGALLNELYLGALGKYGIISQGDPFSNTLGVTAATSLESFYVTSGGLSHTEWPTAWTQIFIVTIDIDPGAVAPQLAGIDWWFNGMDGQQSCQTGFPLTVELCADPNFYDNNLLDFCAVGPCGGAITWNGSENVNWFNGNNWDGGIAPGSSDDAYVPVGTPNDPIIEDYANVMGVLNEATITINPIDPFFAAALIMNDGGTLENNGTIILNSAYDPPLPPISFGGTYMGQVVPDPIGGITGTGDYEVHRYMNITTGTAEPDWEGWHYLSSPIAGLTTDGVYNYYLNTWDETATGIEPDFPWVHIEGDPVVPCTPVTPALPIGKMEGWSVKEDLDWDSYGCPGGTGNVIDMVGSLWAAPYEVAVTTTPGGVENDTYEGYNLVGNPFLAGLDLLAVDWAVANANVDATAYVYNENIQNYITVSGTIPDPFVGNTLPPTLGFMVMANASGNFTLDGSEQAVTFAGINKTTVANTVVLKASSSTSYDIMRIHFMEEATTGYDRLWDAHKLFSSAADVPQIYTPAGENMLATNARQATSVVPMFFKSATSGTFTIEVVETSDFENVVLEDLVTGEQTDLLTSSYTFNYTKNDAEDRFLVHFTPLGIGNNVAASINIWSNDHKIYVQAPEISGDIVVINMMGQEVVRTDIEPGLNTIPVNDRNTYYIVKVISDGVAKTGKVYVK